MRNYSEEEAMEALAVQYANDFLDFVAKQEPRKGEAGPFGGITGHCTVTFAQCSGCNFRDTCRIRLVRDISYNSMAVYRQHLYTKQKGGEK